MRNAGQIVRYADQDYDIAIHSSASGQKFHDVLNSPEKIGTSIKEFYALIMTNQFTVRISPHPDAVAIYAYDN